MEACLTGPLLGLKLSGDVAVGCHVIPTDSAFGAFDMAP